MGRGLAVSYSSLYPTTGQHSHPVRSAAVSRNYIYLTLVKQSMLPGKNEFAGIYLNPLELTSLVSRG